MKLRCQFDNGTEGRDKGAKEPPQRTPVKRSRARSYRSRARSLHHIPRLRHGERNNFVKIKITSMNLIFAT